MTGVPASWAVVATVDEPPALVQAFAAWHLALGAEKVTLCFDRPDDPAADLLEGVAGVQVIRCGTGHWQGSRPAKQEIRQVRNATQIYGTCQADWMLHCDADEFLWPAGAVGAALADLPSEVDCAIVSVAERVYLPDTPAGSVFDGAFRRPSAGTAADALLTRRGLTGHAHGKALTRTRRGLGISIHRPKRQAGLRMQDLSGVELLHFDGLTPLQWVFKLLRRADDFALRGGMAPSPHRQAQIDAILADPAAAMRVHDRLKRLTPSRQATLARKGLLLTATVDPSAVMLDKADLSPAAFDDWLLRTHAADFPVLTSLARA
jgi:hypothetical protein